MKEISVFDVIGPNMIGPSSSHTAGALRIALLARKIAGADIAKVEFVLFGSFAYTYKGHGTDKALLAGIMGFDTEDLRIRESFKIADEKGLIYKFTPDTETEVTHSNTVEIKIESSEGDKISITGKSIGGGNVVVTAIDDVEIDFTGEYQTIMVKQLDKPGVVAHITNSLSTFNINIAFMKLFRNEKGLEAYTIIEVDDTINKDIVNIINNHENIIDTRIIEI
ncbi:MAG: L-serine ammonia-lyase, iron-sulfur-dependent subunit beta [Filifactoraceae bacterium]